MDTASLLLIVGMLTLIFTFIVKLIGFPDQVMKNYKRKSTKGVSTVMMILMWFAYVLWSIYGYLRNDLVLMVGHGLGVITIGIILFQIVKYHNKN